MSEPTCRECEKLVGGSCTGTTTPWLVPTDMLDIEICYCTKGVPYRTRAAVLAELGQLDAKIIARAAHLIPSTTLPTDSAKRKDIPLVRGLLDYFPAALAAVASVSKAGNDQHNPGQEMHHARGKSMDHADCIVRHLVERGTVDTDGQRHMAKVAWRALALLQEELEREEGAPLPRGAKL